MATQDYLEFRLSIDTQLHGQINVTVSESPAGRATITVEDAFKATDVERIMGMLDGSANASHAEEIRTARIFGEKLFNTIFVGPVLDAYYQSLQVAGTRGVRVALNLEGAGALADLPWELLRDPRSDHLSLTRQAEVVRHVPTTLARQIREITLPINVLILISSPIDQPSLDAAAEWQAIEAATLELRERGLLTIDRMENAQLITLQRKLRDSKPYQIFHFVGPSVNDAATRTGMLALEDPRRKTTVPIAADDLARELASENGVRLVVLSTGRTRQEGIRDPFTPVATRLANRGLPAVVEFQFELTEEANREFVQEFYTQLAEGHPIEAALTTARRAVQSATGSLEWATPSLYLNADTSTLFPRRRSYEGNLSTGGLRERVPLFAGIAALLVIGLIILLFLRPSSPILPTVDLAMEQLRVFPPDPTPGEPVNVTVRILNKSDQTIEGLQWSFFTQDPADPTSKPALTDTIEVIRPGETFVAQKTYPFGGWGSFATTAFIENTNVIDTNVTNNVSVFRVRTRVEPLLIDFRVLPNGTEVIETMNLVGDEFDDWRLTISPFVEPDDAECQGAVARISVDEVEEQWRLTAGLPTQPDKCRSLPIVFKLDDPVSDLAAESATVTFIPFAPGTYSLELWDATQNIIDVAEFTVTAEQVAARQSQELRVASAAGLKNTSFWFNVPTNAVTVIQSVTLIPQAES